MLEELTQGLMRVGNRSLGRVSNPYAAASPDNVMMRLDSVTIPLDNAGGNEQAKHLERL